MTSKKIPRISFTNKGSFCRKRTSQFLKDVFKSEHCSIFSASKGANAKKVNILPSNNLDEKVDFYFTPYNRKLVVDKSMRFDQEDT
jgi:hypothetical protein